VADEKVNFIIAARDQATATVKGLKNELNALGGASKGLTGPLGRVSAVTGGIVSPMTLGIGAVAGLGAAFMGAANAALEE
jgi:hypothetical protein